MVPLGFPFSYHQIKSDQMIVYIYISFLIIYIQIVLIHQPKGKQLFGVDSSNPDHHLNHSADGLRCYQTNRTRNNPVRGNLN